METEIVKKGMDIASGMGEFLAPLVQGSLTQIAGMFEDKLKYMRWERQLRLIECSKEKLIALGIEEIEKPLPLKYAIPILQGATLEEDNDLQDLWINLLVNAVANKKIEIKRVYMDILERLSPMEATILQQIYTFSFEENRHVNFATDCLPERIYIYNGQKEKELKLKNDDIELALMNLARTGCIALVRTIGGGELFTIINMTLLGYKFFEACTL